MKLDLTHEARNVLEEALDVLQEQIDSHIEKREDLLSKYHEVSGSLGLYVGEQITEAVSVMYELRQLLFNMKELMS